MIRKLEVTVMFLRKNGQILLGLKKRGFGAGKYNGIGGKIRPHETPEHAAVREVQEEILVTPTQYQQLGQLEYDTFYKGEKEHIILHVFVATAWSGTPTESDHMAPKWFDESKIPYNLMFPDDSYWLPCVLEGKYVTGTFEYNVHECLLSQNVTVSEAAK